MADQFGTAVHTFDFFGSSGTAGSWTTENADPRFLADLNLGDSFADIIGFGPNGVTLALGNGDGTFGDHVIDLSFFGSSGPAGSWTSQDATPRAVADITGDGSADIIGFGPNGVVTSFNDGTGHFSSVNFDVLQSFGSSGPAGSWTSQDATPRFVVDVNGDLSGDHAADIVGFGPNGVVVSINNGDGTFGPAVNGLGFFGSSVAAGSWTSQNADPRFVADLNGDGFADIVGFGPTGVTVSIGDPVTDSFGTAVHVLDSFGSSVAAGSWTSQDATPRAVADVNGDGFADIVGFGPGGAVVAFGVGDGTFGPAVNDLGFFGSSVPAGSWTTQNADPRFLADLTGDGAADIVGFGPTGVTWSESTHV